MESTLKISKIKTCDLPIKAAVVALRDFNRDTKIDYDYDKFSFFRRLSIDSDPRTLVYPEGFCFNDGRIGNRRDGVLVYPSKWAWRPWSGSKVNTPMTIKGGDMSIDAFVDVMEAINNGIVRRGKMLKMDILMFFHKKSKNELKLLEGWDVEVTAHDSYWLKGKSGEILMKII